MAVTAKNMTDDELFFGHKACAGCGGSLALRAALKVLGPNAVAALPAGCMSAVGFNFPQLAFANNAMITPFAATASVLTGIEAGLRAQGKKPDDCTVVGFAGDGGTADIGLQALSGAIDRNDDVLYICYDNEGYMNTGYQRSSTTTEGSRTSTTPLGSALCGKQQPQKYIPLILAMHGVEYCATATPWNMRDMVEKIEKGLAASKRGFAYLHVFSPCPTGWSFAPDQTIEVSKRAVKSNMFPLWEKSEGKYTLNYKNADPIPVSDFVKGIGKFKKLSAEQLASIQRAADERYATVCALAGM